MLYTKNTYCAHPTQLTSSPFLVNSDRIVHYSRYKSSISRWYISLRLDTDPRIKVDDVTRAFTGVESLEVEVWQAMFGSADTRVLKLFEAVRGVSVARVHGSVSSRYSAWLEQTMMAAVGTKIEPYCDTGHWDAWTHGNR